jgi:voltage-gated potassium channel
MTTSMTTATQSLRNISEIRGRLKDHRNVARAQRLLTRMQWPLALAALLVVPLLILEDRTTSPAVRSLCDLVNSFVWLGFVAEFCIGFAAAPGGRRFLRSSWFNLAIIFLAPPFLVPDAFQAAMGLRALRILRLFQLMRGLALATIGLRSARTVLRSNGFPYVLLVTAAAIGLGAIGIYRVERGLTIDSPANALWWATVTVTTVGYGDVNPVTGEGRAIALVLMLVGVGVISIFTASVASFFVGDDKQELRQVEERLKSLEGQVDELLKELKRVRSVEFERSS